MWWYTKLNLIYEKMIISAMDKVRIILNRTRIICGEEIPIYNSLIVSATPMEQIIISNRLQALSIALQAIEDIEHQLLLCETIESFKVWLTSELNLLNNNFNNILSNYLDGGQEKTRRILHDSSGYMNVLEQVLRSI